jgi:hypothetical protein
MDEEGWITFYTAAKELEQAFGISWAAAQKRLRQACAEQLITSMKAPYDEPAGELPFEYWTRVAPSEWREREVDCDGPDKEGCPTEVMIRDADYRHWLNGLSGTRSVPNRSPKQELVKRIIKDIWPDNIPRGTLNKQIERQVGERLKQQGHPHISSDTILRAAGRKQ